MFLERTWENMGARAGATIPVLRRCRTRWRSLLVSRWSTFHLRVLRLRVLRVLRRVLPRVLPRVLRVLRLPRPQVGRARKWAGAEPNIDTNIRKPRCSATSQFETQSTQATSFSVALHWIVILSPCWWWLSWLQLTSVDSVDSVDLPQLTHFSPPLISTFCAFGHHLDGFGLLRSHDQHHGKIHARIRCISLFWGHSSRDHRPTGASNLWVIDAVDARSGQSCSEKTTCHDVSWRVMTCHS